MPTAWDRWARESSHSCIRKWRLVSVSQSLYRLLRDRALDHHYRKSAHGALVRWRRESERLWLAKAQKEEAMDHCAWSSLRKMFKLWRVAHERQMKARGDIAQSKQRLEEADVTTDLKQWWSAKQDSKQLLKELMSYIGSSDLQDSKIRTCVLQLKDVDSMQNKCQTRMRRQAVEWATDQSREIFSGWSEWARGRAERRYIVDCAIGRRWIRRWRVLAPILASVATAEWFWSERIGNKILTSWRVYHLHRQVKAVNSDVARKHYSLHSIRKAFRGWGMYHRDEMWRVDYFLERHPIQHIHKNHHHDHVANGVSTVAFPHDGKDKSPSHRAGTVRWSRKKREFSEEGLNRNIRELERRSGYPFTSVLDKLQADRYISQGVGVDTAPLGSATATPTPPPSPPSRLASSTGTGVTSPPTHDRLATVSPHTASPALSDTSRVTVTSVRSGSSSSSRERERGREAGGREVGAGVRRRSPGGEATASASRITGRLAAFGSTPSPSPRHAHRVLALLEEMTVPGQCTYGGRATTVTDTSVVGMLRSQIRRISESGI